MMSNVVNLKDSFLRDDHGKTKGDIEKKGFCIQLPSKKPQATLFSSFWRKMKLVH